MTPEPSTTPARPAAPPVGRRWRVLPSQRVLASLGISTVQWPTPAEATWMLVPARDRPTQSVS